MPRRKILAVTTTKQPVLDEEHPEILEEARWWVNVAQNRTRQEKDRLTLSTEARVAPTPDAIAALTSGFTFPKTAASGGVDMKALKALIDAGTV